ncbi:phosphotransferase [Candidatus Woesearchaeota archaeon]|nr:phosphotransferase [Nanoarchaeota archaeon]MCB9371042.1 phosphotransferase [Candidatus Woesearchaeota archaeon]USN44240.1 MAG: phosphotransferase [Candidatus Woesearchaeota archaeon]
MAKVNREKFKVYEGVFDEKTLGYLETLKRKGYLDELGKPIKTGKEADVYHGVKGGNDFAVKLYRVTSANFKKISLYINRDYRFRNVKGNLRNVITFWVEKEFRNLLLAYKSGVRVPRPVKALENVLIMEFVGGEMLKDASLSNPLEFFEMLLEEIARLRFSAKLVHGDLSEFNIIVHENVPVLIDFGQGMNIRSEQDFRDFYDLYERDVRQCVRFFVKRYGLELDEDEVLSRLDGMVGDY